MVRLMSCFSGKWNAFDCQKCRQFWRQTNVLVLCTSGKFKTLSFCFLNFSMRLDFLVNFFFFFGRSRGEKLTLVMPCGGRCIPATFSVPLLTRWGQDVSGSDFNENVVKVHLFEDRESFSGMGTWEGKKMWKFCQILQKLKFETF